MPTKPPRPPCDLTFAELRLASIMLASGAMPEVVEPPPPDYTKILLTLNTSRIMKKVADMVIHADRLALAKGVDLAEAIRDRLDPTKSGEVFTERNKGDPQHDNVEGQRPGD